MDDDKDQESPQRNERGQFVAGHASSGGARGAPGTGWARSSSKLYADFAEHGTEAIARVREEKPDQYLKVIASLLPKEVKLSARRTCPRRNWTAASASSPPPWASRLARARWCIEKRATALPPGGGGSRSSLSRPSRDVAARISPCSMCGSVAAADAAALDELAQRPALAQFGRAGTAWL